MGIQIGSRDPARLYVKAQAGFLTVESNGGDLIDMHHLAVGVAAADGPNAGSYIEVGVGHNGLFQERPRPRLEIDGLLSWHVRWLDVVGAVPFAQFTLDSDFGNGADSIQSYFGFDVDLGKLLGTP